MSCWPENAAKSASLGSRSPHRMNYTLLPDRQSNGACRCFPHHGVMVGASTRALQLPSVHTPQSHTQDLRNAILPLSLGQTSVRIPESPSFPPTSSARRLFPWRVERRGQWVKSVAGRISMLRILASSAARLSTPAAPFGGRSVATPQDTTLIAADTTNVAGPKARSFIIGMPPRQCTMSLEWVDDSCSNRWWQVETRSDHPLSSQGLPTFVYGDPVWAT